MKKVAIFCLFAFFLVVCLDETNAQSFFSLNVPQNLYFIENKGQIKDQNANPRKDIQYALQASGMTIYIGNGQLHYLFSKRESCNQANVAGLQKSFGRINAPEISWITNSQQSVIESYRMDVELMGANANAVAETADPQAYYENYYLEGCPLNGIQAHTFGRITYKNLYPNIDWVIYVKGDKLEHEFVLHPGADPSIIRLKYNGQTSLNVDGEGSLVATTPMGIIKEHAPVVYLADGTKKTSAFKLDNNVLSYDIQGYEEALVIDPVLEWGTYYGPDSSNTYFYALATDAAANIYGCGLTYGTVAATIATTGAYQTTNAGDADAFLVKMDSSGHRIWGTYYGGANGDWGTAVGLDVLGNIYMGGSTSSASAIATPGCDVPTFVGGLWAGFLVKFNAAGLRQWGTYVGGSIGSAFDLEISSVFSDSLGHVYATGTTDDTANVTTPGSFKPKKYYGMDTIDVFAIQYDTLTGHKIWGTYYGGRRNEYTGVGCTDGNNVYLAGYTSSDTGTGLAPAGTDIPTTGCYQPLFGGVTDAFIVKFNSSGVRDWGTYYGGSAPEAIGGIAYSSGAVYLLGTTASDSAIASPGCWQPTRAGGADAFIAKFDVDMGFRIWSSYYGGPGDENVEFNRIAADNSGSVYICGYTTSTSGIASSGASQPVYGGGDEDGFLAKFNSAGIENWSTYYGGGAADIPYACLYSGMAVYLCGQTNSIDNIATPGSFLSTGGGATFYFQGFLAKFTDPGPLSTKTDNVSAASIGIYPVPNNGSFTLVGTGINSDGVVKVIITDVCGRIITNEEAQIERGSIQKQIKLNDNTPQGEYYVRIISGNSVNILKFIKE